MSTEIKKNIEKIIDRQSHYIDIKETWRQSFERLKDKPFWFDNRVYSFSIAYQREYFGEHRRRYFEENQYEEFRKVLFNMFQVPPIGNKVNVGQNTPG